MTLLNRLHLQICGFTLLLQVIVNAQPTLMPLGSNGVQADFKKDHNNLQKSDRADSTLGLPFLDDFSNRWPAPDQGKWIDQAVYVNEDFPVNPLSIGVATFDGLDGAGNPYKTTLIHGRADSLTSRYINLNYPPSDSIYLSFFYQPKGIGNFPEFIDTFKVEFKGRNDTAWRYAWSTKGEDYPQTYRPFKAVMIPIKDTAFLKDSFQFRFRNYAQLNGSWDHWHLDYVRLDRNRNKNDTTYNDVAFMYRPSSLLHTYQSVPLSHFLPSAEANMSVNYSISLTNNFPGSISKFYGYKFRNKAGLVRDSLDIEPQGPIVFRQEFEFSDPVKYIYEAPVPDLPWTTFNLVHYLTENTDNIVANDTAFYQQILSNYYALDDGTAEERISINNNGGGLVAQRFDTYKSDTLRSIQFYFNKADDGVVQQPFNLNVWAGGPNVPGAVLVDEGVVYPGYDGLNRFYTYVLAQPVFLPAGSYYFGWSQAVGFSMNVGFDRNFNNNERMFYNLTGTWFNYAAAEGTMMIRPIFGDSEYDTYVGLQENKKGEVPLEWNLFPNPSSSSTTINRTIASSSLVRITDLSGRLIFEQPWNSSLLDVNTANFSDGLYLISITDLSSKLQSVKRLAIRH